jgi:hypothetical protein
MGLLGSTPYFSRAVGFGRWMVLVDVDAVVDHRDLVAGSMSKCSRMSALVPSETAITASAMLQRGAFDPRRHVVAAAELLALPRAQRFQRMHRMHQRNAVEVFGQDAAKVRVPGVHMHQIGVDLLAQVSRLVSKVSSAPLSFLSTCAKLPLPKGVALDPHAVADRVLVAKGADFDMHQSGQFARQILDVNAGSAVDVGRIFSRQ